MRKVIEWLESLLTRISRLIRGAARDTGTGAARRANEPRSITVTPNYAKRRVPSRDAIPRESLAADRGAPRPQNPFTSFDVYVSASVGDLAL